MGITTFKSSSDFAAKLSKTTIKFSIFEQYFDDFVKNTLNALKIVLNNMESVARLKNLCLKSVDALKKQQNKIFLVYRFSNILYVKIEKFGITRN